MIRMVGVEIVLLEMLLLESPCVTTRQDAIDEGRGNNSL
jgi:hypothetical protein